MISSARASLPFRLVNFGLQKLLHREPAPPMSNGPHFSVELTDLSIFESAPAQVSNSDSRWHPKITLYRLSFISTTICLGSAKAVETSHGKSYVSTTIEWIAGVVVFILLSSLISIIYSCN